MKLALSIVLLVLAFLGLIFLGMDMDIDERLNKSKIIPYILLAYMFGAAIVCGIVIGTSISVIMDWLIYSP